MSKIIFLNKFNKSFSSLFKTKKILANLFLVIILVIFDQFSKKIILEKNFFLRFNNFFYLEEFFPNYGLAWNIPLTMPFSAFLFFWLIAFTFILLFDSKKQNWQKSLIIGGALGNLIDRLKFGFVIDFIHLKPLPVFNFADLFITLGFFFWFKNIFLDFFKK